MWAPRDSCGLVGTGGRPACLGGGTWIQLRSLEGAPSRRGGCEGLEQPRAWQSFQSRGLSEQGPACSGTVQAQDTVHFPVGGRGPLLATLMAEVSGTTLGPCASCLSPFVSCGKIPVLVMVLTRRGTPGQSARPPSTPHTVGGPCPR